MTVTQSGETFSTAGGIVIGSEATGVLSIRDNEIDFGEVSPFRTSGIAISPHRTLGIAIIKAGPTELNITGNKVRHVTAAGIDCRNNTVSRLATIELNEIAMGVVGVSKSSFLVSGIRCSGSIDNSGNSEYRVLNNTISCGFEKSAGIRLISNSNSYVQGNKISLSMHDYAVADRLSAGIEIRGNSTGNKIVDNTVSGRAYAALSVIKAKTQVLLNFSPQTEFQDLKPPDGTIFWGNHQMNFIPQLADIHVGVDVENTWLVAPVEGLAGTTVGLAGTVADLGKGTIIIGDFWPAP